MVSVTMPKLGESVVEGTVARWLKREGDRIAKYEPLVEVITDKVNSEVPSPEAGVVTRIAVPEGQTVKVGTEIATIAADAAPQAETAEPAGASAAGAAWGKSTCSPPWRVARKRRPRRRPRLRRPRPPRPLPRLLCPPS